MAYSTGLLKQRVTILNKVRPTQVTWKKGQKALNEGVLDAQDTVMIRMRYNTIVGRDSRLEHDGVIYQIQSLHRDYQDNTIQITATEIVK